MSTISKIIMASSLVLLTACGAKTDAPTPTDATAEAVPKIDASADVRASLPENTAPFDVHLAALKQIADDMNAINSMGDAMKYKKRIAANIMVMNSSLKEYEEQSKGNKTSAINAFRSRQNEYTKAMENYMMAMQTLGQKDPKIYAIIAMELSKVAQLKIH